MLYLLAIACPPLAALWTGGPRRAVSNLGLTLLLYLPGAAHAVSAVARYHDERRNVALLNAVEKYYG